MLNTHPIDPAEQEVFDARCRAVSRYIKKHNHSADTEDLIQETSMRIWKNMQVKQRVPEEGECIMTAKNVLREYWRKIRGDESLDDVEEKNLPSESGRGVGNREKISGCQADCFEKIEENDQILLWRYSFKEEFELFEDETHNSSTHFFQFLNPVVEKIKKMFLSIQAENTPLSGEEKKQNRLRIFYVRRNLIKCLENCLKKYST